MFTSSASFLCCHGSASCSLGRQSVFQGGKPSVHSGHTVFSLCPLSTRSIKAPLYCWSLRASLPLAFFLKFVPFTQLNSSQLSPWRISSFPVSILTDILAFPRISLDSRKSFGHMFIAVQAFLLLPFIELNKKRPLYWFLNKAKLKKNKSLMDIVEFTGTWA